MNAAADLIIEATHESSGHAEGVAVAVVTQNQDDEALARVKVRYPWHENPRESYWARLAVPMAGGDRGMTFIPEIGDEVLVGFDRGDLRFPYVLGALWNGREKPPIANDDGNNDRRIVRSRKHHYLLFDDGAQGVVELAHENGAVVRFTDDEIELKDSQGNELRIERGGNITLQANAQLTIKAATISIEATGTLDLKANATLTVRGAIVNIN
jgi:uncharacterized protein involved in type VI secretion and phage assembly